MKGLHNRSRGASAGRAAVVAAALIVASGATAAPKALVSVGTGGLDSTPSGQASGGIEIAPHPLNDNPIPVTAAGSALGGTASVSTHVPEHVLAAPGLNHHDQRTADNGNQFSLEPPDQALCVGNGFAMEAVNDAIRVRNAWNNQPVTGVVTSLNKFFGLPSEVRRDLKQRVYGPEPTDPKCAYDMDTKRFFVTSLVIGLDPGTGAETGQTDVYIAVSKTSDPTKGFAIFYIDTTNAGDPVNHPGCPCQGDQPLIGLDKNGFFISTNEFSLAALTFNGAQIYAVSKQELAKAANGGPIPALAVLNTNFLATPDAGGTWYSVQPSTSTPNEDDGEYNTDAWRKHGVEYFMSALDFFGNGDTRVAVWALTNTDSLQTPSPKLHVNIKTISTGTFYVGPPNMTQKGSTGLLQSNDDRMNQAVKYGNTLYAGLNTAISDSSGKQRAGIAYWGIKPTWGKSGLNASVRLQGYVTVANNNLAYPSIAVNRDGEGMMAFSLTGPDYYPSAAMIRFNAHEGTDGPVSIVGAGVAPYASFGVVPGVSAGRWGDYSAVADDNNHVWGAAENVPVVSFGASANGGLANWGTTIWRYNP
jgi:hypothetical protein